MISNSLEQHWGTFKYNLFVLTGFSMTVLSAFINPGMIVTNTYFLGAVFLAFATIFPQITFQLFFIIASDNLSADHNHIIFRTSWVYDNYSKNFPNKIIHNFVNDKESYIVDDQVGTPNHVNFIAEATFRCITEYSKYDDQNKLNACGIYHMSTLGETSWYKFGCYLLKQYKRKKNIENTPSILSTSSQDLSLKAARPKYSVLNTEKLVRQFELDLPSWQHYADRYINSKI